MSPTTVKTAVKTRLLATEVIIGLLATTSCTSMSSITPDNGQSAYLLNRKAGVEEVRDSNTSSMWIVGFPSCTQETIKTGTFLNEKTGETFPLFSEYCVNDIVKYEDASSGTKEGEN